MEKDGACEVDRQNKKCSCARKSGRRKNNAGTNKEDEKKLVGHWLRRKCLLKDALEQGRPNYGPRALSGPPTAFLWPVSAEGFCHFSGLVSNH